MSTFPTLIPNSISFDQGRPNVSEYSVFGAGPIRFRHTQYINGQNLQLRYTGLSQTQIQSIRTHYQSVGGIHGEFSVPIAVWGGTNVASGASQYRYAETPQEEHTGINYNVTVSLRVLRGVLLSFILDGGPATLPAEEAVNEYVFSGTAPFILDGTTAASATLVLNATQVS
jgi:hypothetical protein